MAAGRKKGTRLMINDVRTALQNIIGNVPLVQAASGAGRIFELYVMTGIGVALKTHGYDVWVRRSDGTRVSPASTDRRFIQRGGAPGGIPAAAAGSGGPSSLVFRRGPFKPAWELLCGVQFEGRSGADHELDLAIVPESVAQALRNAPAGGKPLGRPRVAIECKDVGANGSIDEMRAFVARLYDLTLLRAHDPYLPTVSPQAIHPAAPSGSIHRPALTYWIENRRTLNIIARRGGFTSGAAALTAYHAVEPYDGIVAGSAAATTLMTDIADWITHRGY